MTHLRPSYIDNDTRKRMIVIEQNGYKLKAMNFFIQKVRNMYDLDRA